MRRQARQVAFQLAYAADSRRADFLESPAGAVEDFFEVHGRPDVETVAFARHLFSCIIGEWDRLDAAISGAGSRWKLDRMGRVEKAIMRVAVAEMLFPDHNGEVTPTEIVIDEAVELAKIFATEEAPAFVNGVLDAIAAECRAAS